MDECEKIIAKALKAGRFALLIDESHRICSLHNVPMPKFHVTNNVDEAAKQANEISYPVVLKIISPEITHKSDIGGVVLNVRSEEELRTKYEMLVANVHSNAPSARVTGVLIEKMMPPSTEVVVGGIRDRQFGPAIMFGMGGVFTEVYDDVTFRVAPIDRIDALNMIHELRGSRILEGVREKPPVDVNSIIHVLTSVSDLMIQHDAVDQLDLNPIIVYPDGVCAVDSRIIITEKGA